MWTTLALQIVFAQWMVYGCVSAINATRIPEDSISPSEAFTGSKRDFKRGVRAAFAH